MNNRSLTKWLALTLAATVAGPALAQDQNRRRGDREGARSSAQQRDDRVNQAQNQQSRRQQGTVTGEVVRKKRVDVRGSDRQQLVVLLKTRDGNRVPVDLGSPGRLGDRMPSVGDQLSIRGRLVRIGDRGIIIGDEMRADGQRPIRIEQRPPHMMRDRGGQQRERGHDEARRRRPRSEDDRPRSEDDWSGQRAGLGVALSGDREGEGVAVMQVLRGSPAAQAGLQAGDRIVAINGTDVASPRELLQAMSQKQPGQSVTLKVQRDGETRELTADLVTRRQALEAANRRGGNLRGRDNR